LSGAFHALDHRPELVAERADLAFRRSSRPLRRGVAGLRCRRGARRLTRGQAPACTLVRAAYLTLNLRVSSTVVTGPCLMVMTSV
jgi:hypothetical protein